MSLLKTLAITTALTTVGLAFSGRANATSTCGMWQMGSTASQGHELIFGEGVDASGNPTGRLAICEQPLGGGPSGAADQVYFEITGCTSSSVATDLVKIYGGAGVDVIGPLTAAHGTVPCGTGGESIMPFAWSLGLHAWGGEGADRIFGTANTDYLMSNIGTATTPDSAYDRLCGMGGNDALFGDADDAAGVEECLDGGPGTDYCDAGDSTAFGDVANACETTTGGFRLTSGSCGCTASASNNVWTDI